MIFCSCGECARNEHNHGDIAVRDVGLYFFRLPRAFYWLCAATLVVMLFWGGSQPFAAGLFPVPYDKIAHSLYFGVLSLLFWLGTGGRWPVLLFVAVSAIGGLDELHQATLPGRVADIYDFLFDTAATGLVIVVLEWNKFALNEIQRRMNKA
jgi:hypothetical protein